MSRLVDPIPENQETLPGKAIFWTNFSKPLCFDTKKEAVNELIKTISEENDSVHRATVNYKTEDGEYLEVVHVQFYRYKKSQPLSEWLAGWFSWGCK